MKTLSIWKPVRNGLRAVAREVRLSWLVSKFQYFPTEKNLFTSNWYAYTHFKRVRPGDTVYDFLDFRLGALEEWLELGKGKMKALYLTRCLLRALYNGQVRQLFIAYLESAGPGENYRPVMAAVWSVCRTADAGGDKSLAGETGDRQMWDSVYDPGHEHLNAKTYFIAAQLFHELTGDEKEFQSLSTRMPDLREFIRNRFAIEDLPGTFEKLKGYSYKAILNGQSAPRKGQLRPPLRQIVEHPEIFGSKVAARAKEILQKSFQSDPS